MHETYFYDQSILYRERIKGEIGLKTLVLMSIQVETSYKNRFGAQW